MLAYLIRRLLQGLFVLVAVIWFTFTLSYFQPLGAKAPAYFLCGTHQTAACINGYVQQYGLGKPYLVRFWDYLFGVAVHFNLGVSFKQTNTVSGLLGLYIPRTFWIAFFALLFASLIAVPLGIYQAWKRNSIFDYAATGATFILYSIPAFVLGFVLLDIFSYHLNVFPAQPPTDPNAWAIFQDPVGFVLPVATLTALSIAGMSRFMRSQVLDVLVQDYIRTARAKGCTSRQVLFRHTMRNALGPIVVIIGLSIPILLSGALIVEDLFNYQGLGYETIYASGLGDIYTVLGITIVVTIATVIGNLAADVALAVLNPRVRIEGASR
ncbi:MAG TPA: ABC transporter permease [Acidimicrobiales bacterium]|jgi:peptide/nickel transport system permease protein|nr:ABC transporter permease [Acidimicrobiales bacterium]